MVLFFLVAFLLFGGAFFAAGYYAFAVPEKAAAGTLQQRLRELRPDMVLLSGGTDGGTTSHVVELAERIAQAINDAGAGGDQSIVKSLPAPQT